MSKYVSQKWPQQKQTKQNKTNTRVDDFIYLFRVLLFFPAIAARAAGGLVLVRTSIPRRLCIALSSLRVLTKVLVFEV